jgi:DNA-binding FadR family transcriptional regulator
MVEYPKMEKQNLYQQIANQIEEMIMSDSLKIGDKLPPEYEIAKKFGVSRNVFREAAKILKERGLINHIPGKGAYIVKPSWENLIDTFTRLVYFSEVSKKQIFEVRRTLEVESTRLAATQANNDDIETLHDTIEQMKKSQDDINEWCINELKFHITIAKATKNPLYYALITPLANLMIDLFSDGYMKDKTKGVQLGITGHKKIYNAIKMRDEEVSANNMREHLLKSERWILGMD